MRRCQSPPPPPQLLQLLQEDEESELLEEWFESWDDPELVHEVVIEEHAVVEFDEQEDMAWSLGIAEVALICVYNAIRKGKLKIKPIFEEFSSKFNIRLWH